MLFRSVSQSRYCGGYIIGLIGAEKYILMDIKPLDGKLEDVKIELSAKERHNEAKAYTLDIYKKIYLYVILGVGVGAFIHGFVPTFGSNKRYDRS